MHPLFLCQPLFSQSGPAVQNGFGTGKSGGGGWGKDRDRCRVSWAEFLERSWPRDGAPICTSLSGFGGVGKAQKPGETLATPIIVHIQLHFSRTLISLLLMVSPGLGNGNGQGAGAFLGTGAQPGEIL